MKSFTDPATPTLECRFQPGPLWLALIGCGVFVALGLALLTGLIGGAPTSIDAIAGKVIGALCVLFFGGISVLALASISRTGGGTVVVVDDDGVYDRRIGPQPIPWSEIRGVELKRGPTLPSLYLRFLELDAVDPDRFRHGSPGLLTRLADRVNRFYGFKPLVISAAVLDHDLEEIEAAIRLRLRETSDPPSRPW